MVKPVPRKNISVSKTILLEKTNKYLQHLGQKENK